MKKRFCIFSLLILMAIFINPANVKGFEKYSNYNDEITNVSNQIYVTSTTVYFKGSTVEPQKFVSQNQDGYYYSGWIPLVRRVTHPDGSVTAYYAGYIRGGRATTSSYIELNK